MMFHHTFCPNCQSARIHFFLDAKDYTATAEVFPIWECDECSLRFTQDAPLKNESDRYYQSDQYISHSDTKKGLTNKMYHLVRSITLNQKRKLIQKLTGLKKGTLLDIGAGTGLFAKTMVQAGWEVTALEPDEKARAKAQEVGVSLNDPSILFSQQASTFDVITLWHVLEHVHELHEYLAQIKTLLKPGGKLIIAVPNYTSRDAAYYKEYWAAYDVPRHLYHFSPDAMNNLLSSHGCRLVSMHPQWFDSFYVSILSEKYKTGKPGLLAGAWQGLKSNMTAMKDRKRCSSLIYVGEATA